MIIYKIQMQSNFLMSTFSRQELDKIIDVMYEVRASEGDEVVTQGDDGDRFFVIESGDLDVVVDDKVVSGLGPGHHFGELALMYDCPRCVFWRNLQFCYGILPPIYVDLYLL